MQEVAVSRDAKSFDYPENPGAPFAPAWSGWDDAPDSAGDAADRGEEGRAQTAGAELERHVQEETRRAFEAGRARGVEEGCKAERQARAEAWAAEDEARIRQRSALIEKFAAEREGYFHALEPEIVRLALTVAARILRREAASDPLLLLGAVRAALGQVAAAAEVRLRVPPAELDLWTEALRLLPHTVLRPAIVAGEGMTLGDCIIESSSGVADLGVRAQLAEMERLLLAAAPGQEEQPPSPDTDPPESEA